MTKSFSLKKYKDYLYIAPAVLFVTIFFISSIIYALRLSFFEWDGFSEMTFVGVDNYLKLFRDKNFLTSLTNTIIWVGSSLVLSLALPLLFAILITKSSWATGFKNIFYFPSALSGTVGGLLMTSILSIYGLPKIVGMLGHPELVRDWLAIPYVNTFVMIVSGIWQGLGLNMLLFISGLRSIDSSPIEAAQIEGAGTFQLYTKVVFPLMKNTIVVVLLMSLVNSFKVFDNIWIMTKGGPYRTSETLALTMYEESFIRNEFGRGAAVAIVLTVIVVFVSYFNIRNSFKED
ncbi:MAG: sugar ABC transporter permease [Lachnospiraceae bacterium]|jgi:ABC-type sugar transport system permease subunit|nr:sugar ABC transporter permease [Lachnospiraceae bacterium]